VNPALSTVPDTYPFQVGGRQVKVSPLSGVARPEERVFSELQIQALAQSCSGEYGQPMRLMLAWAESGMDWEDIYLEAVVPAAQLLGKWWLADRMDFVAVSIASTRLQQTLYDLSPTFLGQSHDANNGLSALLFSTPGSQHSMGVFMLGEFFRKYGWRVSGVPFMGIAGALRNVQSDWFDVLGVSVSTDRCLETVGGLIRELRAASANPDLKIMVGGPMAANNRGQMYRLGADFVGADSRESQRLASHYVRKAHGVRLATDRATL
jgi:methanogenic corrinoid protein MtbC1